MPSEDERRHGIGPFPYSVAVDVENGKRPGLSVTCRKCMALACYVEGLENYYFFCTKDPARNRILNVSQCTDFRFRRSGLDFEEGEI